LDDAIVHVERLNGNTGKPDRLLGASFNEFTEVTKWVKQKGVN
jgi:hypothetical protein